MPVYELEVRGVLLVADSPEALSCGLARVLRGPPVLSRAGPYRGLYRHGGRSSSLTSSASFPTVPIEPRPFHAITG